MEIEPEQPKREYTPTDFTLKEWEAKIDEEEARWRYHEMSLDSLRMGGAEIFAMQCKIQAVINVMVSGDFSEENIALNLKMVVYASMEQLREQIAPQIAQAKLTAGVPRPVPKIVMPWERGNGG